MYRATVGDRSDLSAGKYSNRNTWWTVAPAESDQALPAPMAFSGQVWRR